MKLRNKKTGELGELQTTQKHISVTVGNGTSEVSISIYNSLNELNKDWYDVVDTNVTSMPRIQDEKIRKAVRAWADANGISGCICKEEIHCITFETERGMFISFENADPIPPEGNFTIAELCGEEE